MTERESIEDIKISLDDKLAQLPKEDIIHGHNMNVFVRLRPLSKEEEKKGFAESISVVDDKCVQTIVPTDSSKYKNMFYKPVEKFTFSQAFGSHENQFSVFEHTMKDIIQAFVDGSNSLVFTYGTSGSGKTYTMQGTNAEPGIIPLTVQLIFELLKDKITEIPVVKPEKVFDIMKLDPDEGNKELLIRDELLQITDNESGDSCRSDKLGSLPMSNVFCDDTLDSVLQDDLFNLQELKNVFLESVKNQNNSHYSVWVSFIEIYNEKVHDLFHPMAKKRKCLGFGEDKQGNIFVKGAKEIFVNNCEDIFKLIRVGRKNLRIASTKLNYQSSRSHCILNIKIIRLSRLESCSSAKVNILSFCDLAGSERSCKTNNTGVRLKEAGNINNSLLVLGRCVEALRCNQFLKEKKMVPFRDSKLTYLFSGFFIGKGKASMIINVSPSSYTFEESLHALRFSALAKEVNMVEDQWSNKLKRLSSDHSKALQGRYVTCSDACLEREELFRNEMIEIDAERVEQIEELIAHARELSAEVYSLQEKNKNLESTLRSELSRQFEQYYEKRVNYWRDQYEQLCDKYNEESRNHLKHLLDAIPDYESGGESEENSEGYEMECENNVKDNAGSERKLEENLKEKNLEIQELQAKLNEYSDLMKTQEEKLSQKDATTEQLTAEVSKKVSDLEVISQELETFKTNYGVLEEKLSQKDLTTEQLTAEVSQKTSDLKNISQELDTLKTSFGVLEEQTKTKDSTLEDSNLQINMKDIELTKLRREMSEFQQKLTATEKSLEAVQQDYLSMSTDYNKAIENLKELQVQLEQSENKPTDGLANVKMEVSSEIPEDVAGKENEAALVRDSEEEVRQNIINSIRDMSTEQLSELLQQEPLLKSKVSDVLGLPELEEQITTFKASSIKLEKNVELLSQENSDKELALQQLNKDLHEIHKGYALDLTKLKETVESKESLIKAKDKESAMYKDEVKNLTGSIDALSKTESELKVEIQDLKRKSNTNIQQFESQKKEFSKLETGLKEEINQLKTDVESTQQQLENKEKDFKKASEGLTEKINRQRKDLEQKENALESQNNDSKKVTEFLNEEISELKRIVASKESTIETLEKDHKTLINEKVETISELTNVLNCKDQLIKSQENGLNKVIEDLNEKVKQLEADVAAKTASINNCADDSKKLFSLNEEIIKLKKSVAAKEQMLITQEKDHQQIAEELKEKLKTQDDALKSKEELMGRKCEDSKNIIDSLTEEKNTLKKSLDSKNNELKSKDQGLSSRVESQQKHISELEQTISAKDSIINQQIEDSKRMADDLNDKITQLMSNINDHEKTIKGHEKEAEKIPALERELSNLKKMIEAKNSLIQSLEASRSSNAAENNSETSSEQDSIIVIEEKEEMVPEEPQALPVPVKQQTLPNKTGRGRPARGVIVSSIPSPVRKVAKTGASSSIPTNIRKGKVLAAGKSSKKTVETEVSTPPTPAVKKLRTRTAKVDYDEESPNPSKKKKTEEPEATPSRLSRQKVSKPFRGAASKVPPVVEKPIENPALKAVQSKASVSSFENAGKQTMSVVDALNYLSPKKTRAAQRKKTLYDGNATLLNESPIAELAKPSTSKKTKEPPAKREATKRKLRH